MANLAGADGKLRTSDMVLATLLHMQELQYVHELHHMVRADGARQPSCIWVFDISDDEDADEAEDIMQAFMKDEYRVEPKEFARRWADVRRGMFGFLNDGSRR